MRIIGGQLGGLRFKGPPGGLTRPTPERVREGLASALESRDGFCGKSVLDLFAGTGALSFEALSRGASRALLVDNDRDALRAIGEVARRLGIWERLDAMCLDLVRDPKGAAERIAMAGSGRFDLVFADPPYDQIDAVPPLLDELLARNALAPGSIVAIEHAKKRAPHGLEKMAEVASYRYGDTAVVLLRCSGPREDDS